MSLILAAGLGLMTGPVTEGGEEISPGGTLRGQQNHVSSSTGTYGIGLNIVKLRLFVKKFVCGTIFDCFIGLFYSYYKFFLPAAQFFFEH